MRFRSGFNEFIGYSKKNKFASYLGVKKNGCIYIWKRFGPRSAFQSVHLPGVYTVSTKAKKNQDVFVNLQTNP